MYWFASVSTCSSSSFAQARGEHDLLGNHRAGRHRHGDVPGAGGEALVRPPHRLRHRLEVVDVAVDHRVARQRLDRVALDPVGGAARVHDLQHLHRRRADIQPKERRRLRLEQVEFHSG